MNELEQDENYYRNIIDGIADDKTQVKESEFHFQNQIDEMRIKEKALMSYNENLKYQIDSYLKNEEKTAKSFEKIKQKSGKKY